MSCSQVSCPFMTMSLGNLFFENCVNKVHGFHLRVFLPYQSHMIFPHKNSLHMSFDIILTSTKFRDPLRLYFVYIHDQTLCAQLK